MLAVRTIFLSLIGLRLYRSYSIFYFVFPVGSGGEGRGFRRGSASGWIQVVVWGHPLSSVEPGRSIHRYRRRGEKRLHIYMLMLVSFRGDVSSVV